MRETALRVLVVEDDVDTAALIGSLLQRRLGAEVETAGDCASAARALARGSYDLITLDFSLPDRDGLDMLDEITSEPGHPPVVMITGHGDEELAYLSFRMGASGYAPKGSNLSVTLIEAAEWALADAESRNTASSARGAAGLSGGIRAMARDLRARLDRMGESNRELRRLLADDRPFEVRAPEMLVACADTEADLAAASSLIEKLDSLTQPSNIDEGG